MKIMVLGGGGREHAVVHAFAKSSITTELHCCPGNPGIAKLAKCHAGDICCPNDMKKLCCDLGIELVFVGPEAPLVAGTADALRDAGILVVGPGKSGARLEGSKAFSKQFMKRHNIPTSDFDICTNLDECRAALSKRKAPFVVKADGLAAGKGAFLPETYDEAIDICKMMLVEQKLGTSGNLIVIEDFVPGVETTVLALCDGKTIRVLPSSQDHKRALDGDKGNNTGGMGAYSPVPWIDDKFMKKVTDEILNPTVEGLASDGIPFIGVIYAGIMVKKDGSLSVLEYNVRLGDPETQVVLPAFGGDFGEAALACAKGELSKIKWAGAARTALGVVIASGGYPGKFEKGYVITDSGADGDDTFIYHAGTKVNENNETVTNGGRVLTVVAMADTLQEAHDKAYKRVGEISFKDCIFRKDIGDKSLKGKEK
ncbi:MAG: phosphoribosylamine--glycine ligase [Synergistes sp.]|nr:phosphoribosylamine--glycine ligase [Synergistes sp.]